MVLIISFIFSFKINKENTFPAPTAFFLPISLSTLIFALNGTKWFTNPVLPHAKSIARYVITFLPKIT